MGNTGKDKADELNTGDADEKCDARLNVMMVHAGESAATNPAREWLRDYPRRHRGARRKTPDRQCWRRLRLSGSL